MTPSQIRPRYPRANAVFPLLRGKVWFDVAANADRPFVVATEAGRIRVTGTSFGMRLDDNAAVVSLIEGSFELRNGGAGGDGARAQNQNRGLHTAY